MPWSGSTWRRSSWDARGETLTSFKKLWVWEAFAREGDYKCLMVTLEVWSCLISCLSVIVKVQVQPKSICEVRHLCSWRPDIGRGSFELFLVLDDSPTADLRQISSRFQKDAGPAKEPAISIYGLGGKHLRTNSHVRRGCAYICHPYICHPLFCIICHPSFVSFATPYLVHLPSVHLPPQFKKWKYAIYSTSRPTGSWRRWWLMSRLT